MSLFEKLKAKNEKEAAAVAINPPEAAIAMPTYEEQKALTAKKDAEAAAKASESPKEAEPPKEAKPPKKEKPAPKSVPASVPQGMTLYLDCILAGQAVVFDHQLYAEAQKRILANFKLDDYRFAEYGQGAGILKQMVALILDETPTIEALVVDTRTPESQVCLALFKARAARVVFSTK